MFPNPFKKLKTSSFWLVLATAVILLGVVVIIAVGQQLFITQRIAEAQPETQVIIDNITYNIDHPPTWTQEDILAQMKLIDDDIKKSCKIFDCELPQYQLTINIDIGVVSSLARLEGHTTGEFVSGRLPTSVDIRVRGRNDKEAWDIIAHESTHAFCKLGICVSGVPLPKGVSEGVAVLRESPDTVIKRIGPPITLGSKHLFTSKIVLRASYGNGASLMAYLILLGGQDNFNLFLQAGGARPEGFDKTLLIRHYGRKHGINSFSDLDNKWRRWHVNHQSSKDWEATVRRLKEEMFCPSLGNTLKIIDELSEEFPGVPGLEDWRDGTKELFSENWGTWTRKKQKEEIRILQKNVYTFYRDTIKKLVVPGDVQGIKRGIVVVSGVSLGQWDTFTTAEQERLIKDIKSRFNQLTE